MLVYAGLIASPFASADGHSFFEFLPVRPCIWIPVPIILA